jgi:hypothetical protein
MGQDLEIWHCVDIKRRLMMESEVRRGCDRSTYESFRGDLDRLTQCPCTARFVLITSFKPSRVLAQNHLLRNATAEL